MQKKGFEMDEREIDKIVDQIMTQIMFASNSDLKGLGTIRVEASGRHIHLSKEDAITLFGTKELTKSRELSQFGQFLYEEKVMLIGPKGILKDVAILGPCRGKTQVEISITDARILGVTPVIKDSGDLDGASDVIVSSGGNAIKAKSAAIIARRHLHMSPDDSAHYGLNNGDLTSVRVYGLRRLVFEEVLVRVNEHYSLSLHIDYDEANAVGLLSTSRGEIVK